MKAITNFITESKENPLYTEWDIKDYFNCCINKWFESVRYFNVLNIDNYSLSNMCKQCEIALMLFDKFADDIQLHFYSAESEADKKKYGCCWTQENNIYKAFKIIEQISTLDLDDNKVSFDINAEINELHDRFEELVKKCNNKWHKNYKNTECLSGCAIPCGCECCKCCDY